jgi:hypothetical protein
MNPDTVRDLELLGQVLQHHTRHVQRIGQERPQRPHRGQLQGEPEPVMSATAFGDQRPVGVVEEEGPIQLRLRRRTAEATKRGRLLIDQELNRHGPTT